MIKSGMGTIRSFEFEEPITQDDLPEVDAKIAYIELNGEGFIEIKTLGAVDDTYHPDELQVLRLSESAIDLITKHWEFYHKASPKTDK